MKKLLILSSGVVGLAVAGVMIAPNLVQAQGANGNGSGAGYGYQQSLESKAKILGMTTEQLQTQLKDKTLHEVVEDKGISEDTWHEKMEAANVERWKARGLSQTEIDARLKNMEERQANCDGTGAGSGGGMHGYGRNQ